MFSTLNEKKNNTINWLGFYRVGAADQETLVLGPFQGKVACIRIPFGQGVCGACAKTKVLQLVPDVDNFPGHIACDSNSRSELVVPIFRHDGSFLGVLDIDSSVLSCFSDEDANGAIECVKAAFSRPTPQEPPKRQIKHAH